MHKEFEILNTLASMFLPKDLLRSFTLKKVKEKRKEWRMTLIERTDEVPKEIEDKEISLNGYCKPLELMTFPAGGKPVYLKIKRRRWGVKATKEFADFLKELSREALDKFFNTWPVYRRMWEKDTSLVQRFLKWIQW